MQLIGNSRALIRDAVRKHPQCGATLAATFNHRKVNDLSKEELLLLAAGLGVDVPRIISNETAIRRNEADDTETDDPEAEQGAEPDEAETTEEDRPAPGIEAEAIALRRDLATAMVEGNFDHVTERLTSLLQDAHKPAVVQVQYVSKPGDAGTMPAHVPSIASVATWGQAFSIKGNMAGRKMNVYAPHPTTPMVDTRYRWPDQVTQAAMCALGRGRNVWLYGPAGTGKTSFAEQLAARTGRPFFLIPCDDTTEAPELVGMTVPHDGSTRWQDGVLTTAMRVPNAIILIDEPTVARAGAVMVLQSVLQSRVLSIKETGEMVFAADGLRFLVADNTNGTGGGSSEGYEGTRRMNRATLDRFASFLKVNYMEPADEIKALMAHTNCTKELAKMLVECAGLSRKAKVTHAIGLRRLIAWAEALTDGLDPRAAFEFTILNSCARDDREPTEQCCALGLDKGAINSALLGIVPPPIAPAPELSSAARDFQE